MPNEIVQSMEERPANLGATAAVEFAGNGYPVMELDGGWRWWRDDDFPIEK